MQYVSKLSIFLMFVSLFTQCNSPVKNNEVENKQKSRDFKPDIEIELTAKEAKKQLLPGEKTDVYTYEST